MPTSAPLFLFGSGELLWNTHVMRRANQNKILLRIVLGLGVFDDVVDLVGSCRIAILAKAACFIGGRQNAFEHIRINRLTLDVVLDQFDFGACIGQPEGAARLSQARKMTGIPGLRQSFYFMLPASKPRRNNKGFFCALPQVALTLLAMLPGLFVAPILLLERVENHAPTM